MSSERKHYAIIMPGLGDHGARLEYLTRGWEKNYGIIPVIHLVPWEKREESFQQKLDRLGEVVTDLKNRGDISLIGASAGGSLAFNGLLEFPDKVKNAIDLCGRLTKGSEKGYRSFQRRAGNHPAFAESIERFERVVSGLSPELKKRMLITRGWFDELVPEETLTISGIKFIRVPFVEHGICIALSLADSPLLSAFGKGKEVINFLKQNV